MDKPTMNERAKQELWKRWGHEAHPAEWDGNVFGGGMGSQRFWEYLWVLDQILHNYDEPKRFLDVGGGESCFFGNLLASCGIDVMTVDPEAPPQSGCFPGTLEQFTQVRERKEWLAGVTFVSAISVLQHVEHVAPFCEALDSINAPIALTFEMMCRGREPKWKISLKVTNEGKYQYGLDEVPQENENIEAMTLDELYLCLRSFNRHYISKMERCPVYADDSRMGLWRPMGILLDVMQ